MSSRLPESVDPWRLADQKKGLEGEIPLANLPRLSGLLVDPQGMVRFSFTFRRGEKRRPRITGTVRANLALECQRCLEQMQLPVDVNIDLAVIEVPAEAERLPEQCDPILADNGRIRLLDLLEDELLLAIPQVPMHDASICQLVEHGPHTNISLPVGGEHDECDRNNPFAVLAGCKTDPEN